MEQTSIQSFYGRKASLQIGQSSLQQPGLADDGFTNEEIEATLHPESLPPWQPQNDYHWLSIDDLRGGMGRVRIVGRVANLSSRMGPSPQQPRSRGYHKLLVKDDTGVVIVRLWFSKIDYGVKLGQLVSVWTSFVATRDPTVSSLLSNNYQFITAFPEVDRSCYFQVLDATPSSSLCRLPLTYNPNQSLRGLMTLKALVEGGHEVTDAKVLVCVKSIGPKRRCIVKKSTPSAHEADRLELHICDDTHSATITLWDHLCPSASNWTPSNTILLLTGPTYREDRPNSLGLGPQSLVDVDPHIRDADWLRKYMRAKAQRSHVNPRLPEGVFDEAAIAAATDAVKDAMTPAGSGSGSSGGGTGGCGRLRLFSTLADIDESVRLAPDTVHVGCFSLVVVELAITKLHERKQLCCDECCNVSLHANATTARCKHCDRQVTLRPNPRMITALADATGSVSGAKLAVSEAAWAQLLGRSAEELCAAEPAVLVRLEQRMLYLRVTLVMAWAGEVGRLAVLGALGT